MAGLILAEKYLSNVLPHEMVKCCLQYEGTILECQGKDWCQEVYTRAWQRSFGRTFSLEKALCSRGTIGFYISVAQLLRRLPTNIKKNRSVKHRVGLFQLIRKYSLEKTFEKYTLLQTQHFKSLQESIV